MPATYLKCAWWFVLAGIISLPQIRSGWAINTTKALLPNESFSDDLVVGGRFARPDEFSFIVSVHYAMKWLHLCTGVLVALDKVLTTASGVSTIKSDSLVASINPDELYVMAGTRFSYGPDEQGVTYHDVDDLLIHPEAKYFAKEGIVINDAAVLYLKGNISISDHLSIVPLGDDIDLSILKFSRAKCEIVGWGLTAFKCNESCLQHRHLERVMQVVDVHIANDVVYERTVCASLGSQCRRIYSVEPKRLGKSTDENCGEAIGNAVMCNGTLMGLTTLEGSLRKVSCSLPRELYLITMPSVAMSVISIEHHKRRNLFKGNAPAMSHQGIFTLLLLSIMLFY